MAESAAPPEFRVKAAELRRILKDSCGPEVRRVALFVSGTCIYTFSTDATCVDAAVTAPHVAEVSIEVPLLVQGVPTALLKADGPAGERSNLEHTLRVAAARLIDANIAAEELDSLASEIVHCYEELHLIYTLADSLAGQLTVPIAADLILAEISRLLEASWAELRLIDGPGSAFVRSDAGVQSPDLSLHGSDWFLCTKLRSNGRTIGEISLARSEDGGAFSSADAKLLDAAGSLVAHAIRNAQMYEQLHQQAEKLSESERHLRSVLDNVTEGIITVDEAGTIRSFNPAAERIFGYYSAEVAGQRFSKLFPEMHDLQELDDFAYFVSTRSSNNSGSELRESLGRSRQGQTFPLEIGLSRLTLGASRMFILTVRDITDRKEWEAALERQALYDELTGLYNRPLLYDRLRQHVSLGGQNGRRLALLLMDLDRFKEVNDTLGHQTGDQLLRQIGPRLQRVLRESDTVARLGGDEFAVLLPEADAADATVVASKLLREIEQPFIVEGQRLGIGASIGIAICPEHGWDTDALLRKADIAMYVAKRAHTGFTIYAPDQDHHSADRLALIGELRSAVERNQLILYYQPKVDLKTRRTLSVEALVRWRHPKHGLLLPGAFIPLAEMTGLIHPLSLWVFTTAVAQCQAWMAKELDLAVAVNVSAQYLHDVLVPETIQELLQQWSVPPNKLTVEITESSLVTDQKRTSDVLARLRDMGVRVSIDDFGTGYSSLGYLKQLPVDEIKIDKLFLRNQTMNENDAAIVRSTILLSHDLGLEVVAEGVEDEATLDFLVNLGCDQAQGHYFGHPVPAEKLEEWLRMPCQTATTTRSLEIISP